MEALAALQERLRGYETRIEANHDSIKSIRGRVGDHDVKLAVIAADLEDIHEDVREIKGQLKWVLRGLWAAAATFLMFALGVAGLIAGHP
jgi:chromosome segregation ATPase